MSLTETERQAMTALDAEIPADRLTRRGGLLLADKLRVAVPDADDVTLARVALELMRELGAARDSADVKAAASGLPRHTVRGIALDIAVHQFGGAVLNLTSLEWKDTP